MKKLALLLATAIGAHAAMMTNYITDGFGNPLKTRVTVQPYIMSTVFGGTNVLGPSVGVACTNGAWSVALLGGFYWVDQGIGQARVMVYASPGDIQTNNLAYFASAATNPVPSFYSSITFSSINTNTMDTNSGVLSARIEPQVGNNMGAQGIAPVIIWDDDFVTDLDNMMALETGLSMMQKGLINIVATVQSTSKTVDWLSAPMAEAFCNYYGYSFILSGADANRYPANGQENWAAAVYTNMLSRYYHTLIGATNAPSALRTYRTILAKAPVKGVKIIMGGPLENLENLWNSGADDISPLNGQQLISRAVEDIIIISGSFPYNTNNAINTNFNLDNESAWVVTNLFPCHITYIPPYYYFLGGGVITNRNSDDIMRNFWTAWTTNALTPFQYPAGAVYKWTDFAPFWAAYGTNDTPFGKPMFTETWGHIHLADVGANTISNWWTTDVLDQRYLSWPQTAQWYVDNMDTNFIGVSSLKRMSEIKVAKGDGTQLPVQYFEVQNGSTMLVVSNGFVVSMTNWNPLALNCVQWWYDTPSATNTVDSTTIGSLADLGPYGGTATNTVAGPQYKTSVQNGLPASWFYTPSGNYLKSQHAADGLPFTMWAVFYATNTTVAQQLFGGDGNDLGVDIYNGGFRIMKTSTAQEAASAASSLQVNTWYIAVITEDATHHAKFWTNCVSMGTDDTGVQTFAAGHTHIGAYSNTGVPTQFFGGYIAEIGKCTNAISATQVTNLFNWLNAKWAVY